MITTAPKEIISLMDPNGLAHYCVQLYVNYLTSCDPHHGILSDIYSHSLSVILSGIHLSEYILTVYLAFYLTNFLTFCLPHILAFYLAYILTFYLSFYLAFYLTYILAFYLTYILAFYLANILAYFLANILAYFLAYILAFCSSVEVLRCTLH